MANKAGKNINKISEFNEAFLKVIPFGLDIVDCAGNVLYMNEKLKSIVGKNAIGKKCWELYKDDKKQCKDCPLKKKIEPGKAATVESENLLGGRTFLITHTPMIYEGKKAMMEIFQDTTERKKLEEELRSMSLKDELTRLYNRRGFIELAGQELKFAKRHDMDASLLFIHLDKMKWINDTLGHSEGDKALVKTAAVLKKTCRESDIIARIGGDEFAIFALGLSGKNSHFIINRLRENLAYHNRKISKGYSLSISVGMASCKSAATCSIQKLLTLADKLMYKEKKSRINNFT